MALDLKKPSILPGFNLTLGFTVLYLSLIVLVPLSALCLKAASLSWAQFWHTVSDPRVIASYRLSFGASLAAAVLNAVFGLLVAWVGVNAIVFVASLRGEPSQLWVRDLDALDPHPGRVVAQVRVERCLVAQAVLDDAPDAMLTRLVAWEPPPMAEKAAWAKRLVQGEREVVR